MSPATEHATSAELLDEISATLSAMAHGDFERRFTHIDRFDEFRPICINVNDLMDKVETWCDQGHTVRLVLRRS